MCTHGSDLCSGDATTTVLREPSTDASRTISAGLAEWLRHQPPKLTTWVRFHGPLHLRPLSPTGSTLVPSRERGGHLCRRSHGEHRNSRRRDGGSRRRWRWPSSRHASASASTSSCGCASSSPRSRMKAGPAGGSRRCRARPPPRADTKPARSWATRTLAMASASASGAASLWPSWLPLLLPWIQDRVVLRGWARQLDQTSAS